MSGEIVNLNKARKARRKADAKERAGENRARYGQTTAERAKTLWEKLRADRVLKAHKRDEPKKD